MSYQGNKKGLHYQWGRCEADSQVKDKQSGRGGYDKTWLFQQSLK